jgi:hypothetical protein
MRASDVTSAAKLNSDPCVTYLGRGEGVTTMKPNDQLEPTVFVIFGGAGDLTWRKLVPALFDLSQDRSLPADFSVIAVDRVDLSDDKLRRRLAVIGGLTVSTFMTLLFIPVLHAIARRRSAASLAGTEGEVH